MKKTFRLRDDVVATYVHLCHVDGVRPLYATPRATAMLPHPAHHLQSVVLV